MTDREGFQLALDFWRDVERDIDNDVANISLRRMKVQSIESDGNLVLRELGSGTIHDEPYTRLRDEYSVGDFVLVGEIAGRGELVSSRTRVVLGVIRNDVDTTPGSGIQPAQTNQEIVFAAASTSGTSPSTGSTTSTTVWEIALARLVTLPSGTWRATVIGGMALKHSVGSAQLRIEVDGVADTANTLNLVTEMQVTADADLGTIAGGRIISMNIQFKGLTAGTTNARNPWLYAVFQKTGL